MISLHGSAADLCLSFHHVQISFLMTWLIHFISDLVQTVSEHGANAEPDSIDTVADVAPAPSLGPGCPFCVTTGTVRVLHDVCNKQGI